MRKFLKPIQTFHDFIQGYSAIRHIEIQIISTRLTRRCRLRCWGKPECFPLYLVVMLSTVLHNLHKISARDSMRIS